MERNLDELAYFAMLEGHVTIPTKEKRETKRLGLSEILLPKRSPLSNTIHNNLYLLANVNGPVYLETRRRRVMGTMKTNTGKVLRLES
jgi:hypothetical protein